MATFSQQFLANLGNAGGMLQGASDLGGAIGGVPGQMKQKRVKQEDATALARVKEDPEAWFNLLSQQAMRDGDRIKAAEYRAKAADAGRRATLIGREDEAYRREGQERDAKKDADVAQTMYQLKRLQSVVDDTSATSSQKKGAANLIKAVSRAGDSGGAAFAGQVDLLLEGKSYDSKRFINLGGGGGVFDQKLQKFLNPDGTEKKSLTSKEIAVFQRELLKLDYKPENVFKAVTNEGVIDLTLLGEKEKEKEEVGEITPVAEKEMLKISEAATEASLQLSRNQTLIANLSADEEYYAGVFGSLKTQVLGFAGLRDASEEDKTAYIRSRNQNLVQGLPPGVASDKDIELVKLGLPPDDAGKEEIIRYLQAESRVLQARSDIAILAENHIKTVQQEGVKATMIGLESKKIAYGSVIKQSRLKLEEAKSIGQGAYALEIERQKEYLREAVGFVPSYMRDL